MEQIFSTPAIALSVIALASGIVTAITTYLINYKPNKFIWEIGKKVDKIEERLNEYCNVVTYHIGERNIVSRLNHISKHAIEYTKSINTSVLINKFVDKMISFTTDITKIGIKELSKEQIISKILALKCLVYRDIKDSNCEFVVGILNEMSTSFSMYKDGIIDIYEDSVNDKTSRFVVKTEDFIHIVIKKIVILSNEQEGEKNENSEQKQ